MYVLFLTTLYAICGTQNNNSEQGIRRSPGGGVEQMTSAEKPKINGCTQITIYYRVNEITTTSTEYSHVFVRDTRAHIYIATQKQESSNNAPSRPQGSGNTIQHGKIGKICTLFYRQNKYLCGVAGYS
jgi:hypothetical protein